MSARILPENDVRKLVGCVLGAVLTLAAAGCRQPSAWTPEPVEESMTTVRSEIESAAEQVEAARSLLPIAPGKAEEPLDEAHRALERLLHYYLPLVDARARAYEGYRHCFIGETQAAEAELDRIEAILLGIAAGIGPHLEPEIARRLETVSDARAAITATPEEAPELLKQLAHELNFMVVKGELIVPDGRGAESSAGLAGQG